jgi:hypothetical protein
MTDPQNTAPDSSRHGVHAAEREDGGAQEDPAPEGPQDQEAWAEATETGGEATS